MTDREEYNSDQVSLDYFIRELKQDPPRYGNLVGEMVAFSNRFTINLPFVGTARYISQALKNSPFSIFYLFERTLAHKLHPLLFGMKLNIITDYRLKQHFLHRFNFYGAQSQIDLPYDTSEPSGALGAAKKLQNLIDLMVGRDGHFMVIKYYDYILSKDDAPLASLLKKLEYKVNFLIRNYSDNQFDMKALVLEKYEEFVGQSGAGHSELFKERLSWDPLLEPYVKFLEEDGEEGPVDYEGMKRNADAGLVDYTSQFRKRYLDPISDDASEDVKRLILALYNSNVKKHGEEKGAGIVKDMIDILLEDPLVSRDKKTVLGDAREELYGSAGVDDPEDVPDVYDEDLPSGEDRGDSADTGEHDTPQEEWDDVSDMEEDSGFLEDDSSRVVDITSDLTVVEVSSDDGDDEKEFHEEMESHIPDAEEPSAEEDVSFDIDSLVDGLRKIDWDREDAYEETQDSMDAILEQERPEDLALLLSTTYDKETAPEARDLLTVSLAESSSISHQEIAHQLDSISHDSDDSEDLQVSLAGALKDAGVEEGEAQSISSMVVKQAAIEKESTETVIQLLEESDPEKAMEELARAPVPREVSSVSLKILHDIKNKKLDDAIFSITSSANTPAVKVKLLRQLLALAVRTGLVGPDAGDPGRQKIEQKVAFYEKILQKDHRRASRGGEKRQENGTSEDFGKAQKTSGGKKDAQPSGPVYTSARTLVRIFGDNINALAPAINFLKQVCGDAGPRLIDEYNARRRELQAFSQGLEDGLRGTGDIDEAAKAVARLSPKIQYGMLEGMKIRAKVKSYEELFAPLAVDGKLPAEVNRIIRIVKSNNKNDLLKKMVTGENRLVKNIMENLTVAGLKKLRRETRSRQDKDKIYPFIEILRITGEPSSGAVSSPGKGNDDGNSLDDLLLSTDPQVATGKENSYPGPSIALFMENPGRRMLPKHTEAINDYLEKIALKDAGTIAEALGHSGEIQKFFSAMMRNKLVNSFPPAAAALRVALMAGIVQKEEL